MLKIARHAGATVERDGADACAWLSLPPDTLASQAEQVLERRAGEFDYQFKRQARRLRGWAGIVGDIRRQMRRSTGMHAIRREE
ncbi:MAG TPA: hypothetical protein VFR90_02625 [Methylibium sp.]|nr:hypothetical protein [Methylibium sp.]